MARNLKTHNWFVYIQIIDYPENGIDVVHHEEV